MSKIIGSTEEGDALILRRLVAPVTTSTQSGLHGGDSSLGVPSALYARAPSSGVDRPLQSTNFEVIYYTGSGSPSGQWYADWTKLYADIVAWRNTSAIESTVALIYLRSSLSIPSGSFDLNRVEFVSAPGAGTLTFADGCTLARPFYRISNCTVRFDSITTRVYTGSVRAHRYYNCDVRPTDAATVEPFLFTSTNQSPAVWPEGFCSFVKNAGGLGLWRQTGTTSAKYLSPTGTDWEGNLWTTDGSGNTIQFQIESSNQQNGQVSFPTHVGGFPDAALAASTATIVRLHNSNIENIGSCTLLGAVNQSKYGRIPLLQWGPNGDSVLLRPGLGADVAMSRSQSGEVQPAIGGAALVADGLWTYSGALAQDAGGPAALGGFGWIFNIPTLLAVVGSTGGWASGGVVTEMGAHPFVVQRISIPDATSIRFFIGLTGTHYGAARTGAVGTDTPSGDLLGFQFSADRGDANYQILTQQAAGAPNLVNTGIAVATYTSVYLVIDCRASLSGGASQVTFYLLDAITRILLYTTTVTTAASLPASGSDLGYVSEVETRAAATRSITTIMAQISHGDV